MDDILRNYSKSWVRPKFSKQNIENLLANNGKSATVTGEAVDNGVSCLETALNNIMDKDVTATATGTATGTEDVEGLSDAVSEFPEGSKSSTVSSKLKGASAEEISEVSDAISGVPDGTITATMIADVDKLNAGKATYNTVKKDIESNPIKATIELSEIRPGNAGDGTEKTYGEVLNNAFEGMYPHQQSPSPSPSPTP